LTLPPSTAILSAVRKRNRLLAVGIVGVAVIAACIGNLTLSETEERLMSYPTSASAGSVMVGQMATTPAIVFTPATELDDDTIMSISENCANWTLNLNPLPAIVNCNSIGGSAFVGGAGYGSGSCVPSNYSFTATFTPSGPGLNSCPVIVAWRPNGLTPIGSGSGTATGTGSGTGSGSGNIQTFIVTLNGNGVAPSYGLTTIPASGQTLEYTDIPITGPSSAQRVTITNNGSVPITAMGANSNPTAFPVASVSGSTFASQPLQVGQSAFYDVACNPTVVTTYTGMLTFSTSQAQGGIVRTLMLHCNGISSDLAINPNPASFARNTLVGVPPPDVTINITNNGAATTFNDVHLQTSDEVTIVGQPMSPLMSGSATTIVLRYSALTEHPSGLIDNLVITHTPGSTRTIAVNAEALVGEIGVTPAVVDFGPVCSGSEKTANLMVYAASSGPVNLMSITQPGSPFTITGTGGPLQPNHGNTIPLTARVNASATGDLADKFTLNTNLPGVAATHDVQLTGVALPSGVTPTPSLVHFGPGRVGTPTTGKKVTISNCGTTPLEITGARIEGANATEFAIVGPEDPLQTIPTMGALEFLVIMNPSTTGSKTAKLVIQHADGVVETELDGNGFGVTDGGEKTTYYACSTGNAAGGAPIALALLLLRRRRRAA
jgi:hypothetical protein